MTTWDEALAFDFPATTREDLLLGLLIKDLLHGSSFDVEVEEPALEFAVDFIAGDELEEGVYRLLIGAEVEGPEDHDVLHQFTAEVLEEFMEEARGTAEQVTLLGARPLSEVVFRRVAEDDERWDLVAPDWLAPDGSEVPFGFRPFLRAGGATWPDDATLDAHGRVLAVPFADELHLFGTPLRPDEEEPE